jgi:GTP cyclohydrolase FolE2
MNMPSLELEGTTERHQQVLNMYSADTAHTLQNSSDENDDQADSDTTAAAEDISSIAAKQQSANTADVLNRSEEAKSRS